MEKKICIKATISGKVQGVFFRKHTREKAKNLQLTGWVKNTENNKVELRACGDRDRIMELTDWLWQGSPASEVRNVQWEEIPIEKFDDFTVKR